MRRWLIHGVAVLLAVMAGVVYFTFDPAQAAYFPRCTFLTLTGYQCPRSCRHHLLVDCPQHLLGIVNLLVVSITIMSS